MLISSSAPTLIAVLQFCTAAPWRVPRTLTAATAAMTTTAATLPATGPRFTSWGRYRVPNATERVAIEPLPITKNIAQP